MPKGKKAGPKAFSAKRSLNAGAIAAENQPPAGSHKGHYEQDPKRRIGQHKGAGEPPLMKK